MDKKQETILIVDNDPTSFKLIRDNLRQANFEVAVAEDGNSALQYVQRNKPTMILFDLMVPKQDGSEMLAQLQANLKHQDILIIFLTSLMEPIHTMKNFGSKEIHYIIKPIQAEELLDQINTHLTIHKLRQKLHQQTICLQQEKIRRLQAEFILQRTRNELKEKIDVRTTELKKTKSQLHEKVILCQEQQKQLDLLKHVMARMDEAVVITEGAPIDQPGPRILYVNEAFTRLTGYSSAEVIGKTPRILQGPNTQREALDQIRDALKNRSSTQTELINYDKAGQEHWVALDISPVGEGKDTEPDYWVAIYRDMTAYKEVRAKQIEQEHFLETILAHQRVEKPDVYMDHHWGEKLDQYHRYEEKLRQYEKVVESSDDLIFALDRNYTYLLANEIYLSYRQSSREEIIGCTVSEVWGQENFEELKPKLDRCLAGEYVSYETTRHYGTRGKRHLLVNYSPLRDDDDKTVIGIVVIIRDITHSKQTKEALQRTNQELTHRIEELSTLNLIAQTVTTITDLNTALQVVAAIMTRLFNGQGTIIGLLTAEQNEVTILAHHYLNRELPSLMESTLSIQDNPAILKVIQSGQALVIPQAQRNPLMAPVREIMVERKIETLLNVPLLVQGKVIGFISIASGEVNHTFSHTELTLAETIASQIAGAIETTRLFEKERQQRKLTENRNKELDAFARTVAHDLKGPLGLVIGFADYLVEYFSDLSKEEMLPVIQKIRQSGHKGVNIINELLLLAGVRKGKFKCSPLNMAEIVKHAQQNLVLMIEEYGGKITLPESWPTAQGYAPWIEEVWTNYISNGLKYGGRPPRLELGATVQENRMIQFWIQDNGLGLRSEEQEKLFTEFTRLSDVQVSGHGLGLSIVRRIVEKLGGEVGVISEVGQGSRFYFTLPQATEKIKS